MKIQIPYDPYNDNPERLIIANFFESKKFTISSNEQKAGIDLSGWQHGTGKTYGIEIGKTARWKDIEKPYPYQFHEIPFRKWRHFKNALHGKGYAVYDAALYCEVSANLDAMAIFNIKDLLKIDIKDSFNITYRKIRGEDLQFVCVPENLVKQYIKLVA